MRLSHLLIFLTFIVGCSHRIEQCSEPPNLLCAHNDEREKYDLPWLRCDDSLDKVAQAHAEWMAAHDSLKHQSLNGLLKDWRAAGENIACGQTTINEVMRCWMESSGHKKNILSRSFNAAGFGKAVSKNGTIYWCADFGGK